MDCSPLGSSVHGILQARILEWVAISFSRGSSWPRDRPRIEPTSPVSPALVGRFFTTEPPRNGRKWHLRPNRVLVTPQPYQWCWSPFFYKSDLQILCINQRRERRGRLKLIEWSKNKLTEKHLLIFKTEKVARYLWNYHCRIHYKRLRSADSRELLFIETEQSAGVGMSTLVRRRHWTGGPRLSRHLEAETRPAWSSHLYQAVLGEQQDEFSDSFIVSLFATTPEILLSVMFFFESSRDFSLRGSRSPRRHSGLPWWLSDKESTCNAGDARDMGLIPGLGRSPGGGHGNPQQYSCLENPMDRGAWQLIVHGVAKSCTWLKRISSSSRQQAGNIQLRVKHYMDWIEAKYSHISIKHKITGPKWSHFAKHHVTKPRLNYSFGFPRNGILSQSIRNCLISTG